MTVWTNQSGRYENESEDLENLKSFERISHRQQGACPVRSHASRTKALMRSGGGLNIGAVDLVIGSSAVRADVLTSWVGLGINYIAGSETLSVDPADVAPVPTTFTTMGNTAGVNGRMRVTVTWSKLVPEPTACLLMSCGLIGMACGTRRRSK